MLYRRSPLYIVSDAVADVGNMSRNETVGWELAWVWIQCNRCLPWFLQKTLSQLSMQTVCYNYRT